MPRFTDEQIKLGLLHDDRDVRSAALGYFTESWSSDPSVMPIAIQAIERFGDQAFNGLFRIGQLRQTDDTTRWAVEQWKARKAAAEKQRDDFDFEFVLRDADPRLVQRWTDSIFPLLPEEDKLRIQLERRIRLLDAREEDLWQNLESICEELLSEKDKDRSLWREACDVVEEIGRRGVGQAERMMTFLQVKVDADEDIQNEQLLWMEIFAAQLAGDLSHEPAIPFLISKFRRGDEDYLRQAAETALIKIGGDETVRALRSEYSQGDFGFKLNAASVLGRVHCDSAIETLIDLCPRESDPDAHQFLEFGLVTQFSTEANEIARQEYLKFPEDRSFPLYERKRELVAVCTFMGQEFPELERWRSDLREEERTAERRRRRMLEQDRIQRFRSISSSSPMREGVLAMPLPRKDAKVGRNDPCPCGSGKKWKKCCMAKEAAR